MNTRKGRTPFGVRPGLSGLPCGVHLAVAGGDGGEVHTAGLGQSGHTLAVTAGPGVGEGGGIVVVPDDPLLMVGVEVLAVEVVLRNEHRLTDLQSLRICDVEVGDGGLAASLGNLGLQAGQADDLAVRVGGHGIPFGLGRDRMSLL